MPVDLPRGAGILQVIQIAILALESFMAASKSVTLGEIVGSSSMKRWSVPFGSTWVMRWQRRRSRKSEKRGPRPEEKCPPIQRMPGSPSSSHSLRKKLGPGRG